MISRDVLDILACPVCKARVRLEREANGAAAGGLERGWLVCTRCGRRYPIRDGIPAMRIEDAIPPAGTERGEGPPS